MGRWRALRTFPAYDSVTSTCLHQTENVAHLEGYMCSCHERHAGAACRLPKITRDLTWIQSISYLREGAPYLKHFRASSFSHRQQWWYVLDLVPGNTNTNAKGYSASVKTTVVILLRHWLVINTFQDTSWAESRARSSVIAALLPVGDVRVLPWLQWKTYWFTNVLCFRIVRYITTYVRTSSPKSMALRKEILVVGLLLNNAS